jgi:OOP family OmpA-OmpF porin
VKLCRIVCIVHRKYQLGPSTAGNVGREDMSLLTDLFSTLGTHNLGEIAGALGESDKSVSDGLRSSIATVLGGMASKSSNPSLLREALELAAPVTEGVSWPNAASTIADPGSPVMSVGRRVLASLFGDSTGRVTNALTAGTGLPAGKMSSLLAMAAPIVMSFLGRRVRDEGMSMTGLGTLLQHEAPAIRSALPQAVTDLLWPRERATVAGSPVMTQTAIAGSASRARLLPLLLMVALIPALFWLIRQGRKPSIETPPVAVGTANRAMPEPTFERSTPSLTKSLDVKFESGSTTLLPESQARLKQFAEAFAANPSSHVLVNGYTDNVGSRAANLRLSQKRANAVKADLVHMGIPADRLSARGFADERPAADNATAEGRETNRRVSVLLGGH